MAKEFVANIEVDDIDDPSIAMRTVMDEEQMQELIDSIRMYGLIQPITVRAVGKRYELIAGHRRLTAHRRMGKPTIAASIRVVDEQKADAMRMHENLFREDVNPVDEARYIRLMVDRHGKSPEELAESSGKSVSYLLARYHIFDMPDYLQEALKSEMINLTSAQWLNRITDDAIRKEYTRFACIGGITATRARAWFESWKAGQLPRDATQYVAPAADAAAPPRVITMPCALCRHEDDITNMTMTYVHLECEKAAARMVRDAAEREDVAAPAAG